MRNLTPYAPRRTRFHALRRVGDWTLKVHSVVYGGGPVDWRRFEPAWPLLEAALPAPDEEHGRPGLGFVIAHQGLTGDYLVLAWWDHENELPLRVWLRRGADESFRSAEGGESICVWDLEVIAAERAAWIDTMLAAGGSDPAAYLARVGA